jgi:hypothetical protein
VDSRVFWSSGVRDILYGEDPLPLSQLNLHADLCALLDVTYGKPTVGPYGFILSDKFMVVSRRSSPPSTSRKSETTKQPGRGVLDGPRNGSR